VTAAIQIGLRWDKQQKIVAETSSSASTSIPLEQESVKEKNAALTAITPVNVE
jgi:hypothetical protein